MNLEVKSRNSILLVINDGLKVCWMEQCHIILRRIIKLSSSPLKGRPRGPLWQGEYDWVMTRYGTSSSDPLFELLYKNEVYNRVSIVREVSLINNESRVQINTSYFLTMCLHGMCPSSTIGKQNTLHRSRLQLKIPCFATMVCVG